MAKRAKKPAAAETAPAPEALPPPPLVALEDIIGQARAVATIDDALRSRRVHHAWIFQGPAGVGKFTTACAFAAAILDPTTAPDLSGRVRPDHESQTRRLIAAGTHPDLHVVSKELARFSEDRQIRERKLITIPKDVVEEHLLKPAALAPTLRTDALAKKVFIVDEAELLDRSPTNAPVQNALLKTMEEPAEGTVIILVTSAPERLLPTIRSRCQRVAFCPLSDRDMGEWLERHLAASGATAPPEAERRWTLSFAAGSPGEALLALRTGVYEWRQRIGPMLDELGPPARSYPLTLGQTMYKLIDEWAGRWVDEHPNASKDAANRAGARVMFRLVGDHLRERLGDHRARAAALAAIDHLVAAERQMDSNVQAAFVFENWAAQVAAGALS